MNIFNKEVNDISNEIPVKSENVSSRQKWLISILSAIIFIIISMPILYKFTNKICPGILDINGTPTIMGICIHALVFMLITRIIMKA